MSATESDHMQASPGRGLILSLAACSIPGTLIAVVATVGAALGWGDLSFRNPVYYAILGAETWYPASKLIAWRLWQREVETCLTCVPAKSIGRRFRQYGENP